MSVESMVMMVIILGGYLTGAFVLLNKVFASQSAKTK